MPCAWSWSRYQGVAIISTMNQAKGSNVSLSQRLKRPQVNTAKRLAAPGTKTAIGPFVSSPSPTQTPASRIQSRPVSDSFSGHRARQMNSRLRIKKAFRVASAVAARDMAGMPRQVALIKTAQP